MKDKQTIMVIEDEVLLLQAIARKLELSGFNVVSCSSAEQAVDYLKNMNTSPALIWLDYYLKDMNGLDFMKMIKANPLWSKIPVVVVSNSASEQKQNALASMGIKKYILKAENTLSDIIKIVNEVLNENSNN
ncbi:MAG: response regulator [Candidatus Woesebacteria bacterium]|nr:MAG: response regulator [Candidatus Woesebacteria bacterium]